MKQDNQKSNSHNLGSGVAADRQNRKPYVAPKILSSERLEAAAATCSPPAPPLGKTVPVPCGTLGS